MVKRRNTLNPSRAKTLLNHVQTIMENRVYLYLDNLRIRLSVQHLNTYQGLTNIITSRETFKENRKIVIILNKDSKEVYSELYLHEITELEIYEAIRAIYPKAEGFKVIENVAHFLSAYSLNQYDSISLYPNPILEYSEWDKLPSFESEIPKEAEIGQIITLYQKKGNFRVITQNNDNIELEYLNRAISDLYREKVFYKESNSETLDNIKSLLTWIKEDYFNYHKSITKNLINAFKDKNLCYKRVFSRIGQFNLEIIEKEGDWKSSAVRSNPESRNPEIIKIGFFCSQKEVIISFLHEIGHILTWDFVKEYYFEEEMTKWRYKRLIAEIVAWKKALELIKALNLQEFLNKDFIKTHIEYCLRSYFSSYLDFNIAENLASYLISFYLDGDLIKTTLKRS